MKKTKKETYDLLLPNFERDLYRWESMKSQWEAYHSLRVNFPSVPVKEQARHIQHGGTEVVMQKMFKDSTNFIEAVKTLKSIDYKSPELYGDCIRLAVVASLNAWSGSSPYLSSGFKENDPRGLGYSMAGGNIYEYEVVLRNLFDFKEKVRR